MGGCKFATQLSTKNKMKHFFRFITIVSALFFASSANAQWKTSVLEADELRGTEERVLNTFSGDKAIVTYESGNIIVWARKGRFDEKNRYVNALIGYYKDGKLIDKEQVKFFYTGSPSQQTVMARDIRKREDYSPKIAKHLKEVGDVRFVIDMYDGVALDFVVPMYIKLQ